MKVRYCFQKRKILGVCHYVLMYEVQMVWGQYWFKNSYVPICICWFYFFLVGSVYDGYDLYLLLNGLGFVWLIWMRWFFSSLYHSSLHSACNSKTPSKCVPCTAQRVTNLCGLSLFYFSYEIILLFGVAHPVDRYETSPSQYLFFRNW